MSEDEPPTVRLLDGPLAGNWVRMGVRLRPDVMCTRTETGPWLHYIYVSGDEYSFQGFCDDVGHVIAPIDWCELFWTDDTGGEHRCGEFGPHDMHACCCGALWISGGGDGCAG